VAVLAIAGVGVAVLVGGGDGTDPIAVPPGATACPSPGTPAVCITAVRVSGGNILADFESQDVKLSSPVGDAFPAGTLHPIFFFDVSTSQSRVWGASSPFGGTNSAGLSGFTEADTPATTARLCVLLQDETGQVISGSGNCAPLS